MNHKNKKQQKRIQKILQKPKQAAQIVFGRKSAAQKKTASQLEKKECFVDLKFYFIFCFVVLLVCWPFRFSI